MEVIRLSCKEVEAIYHEHMVFDFHHDELKPLDRLIDSINKGIYDCFGLIENDQIIGYAFFVNIENNCLLDYFAIVKSKRNNGLGSYFLTELSKDYFDDAESIIIEVENPEFGEDDETISLMKRRIVFYEKNGFELTDIKAILWGVHYLIMVPHGSEKITTEEIRRNYINFYKSTLTPELFNNNVHI